MKKIVLIGGQKGGTGKSTITANIACISAHQGFKTLVIDGDVQGTTSSFWKRRAAKDFDLKTIDSTLLADSNAFDRYLEVAKAEYDIILIDVGGHDSKVLRLALSSQFVDTLLSPAVPSYADVETLQHVDSLVAQARRYNASLDACVLLSRTHTNPNVLSKRHAMEFVEQFCPHLDALSASIAEREVMKASFAHALSVLEFETQMKKPKKATLEFQKLWQELFGLEFNALGKTA